MHPSSQPHPNPVRKRWMAILARAGTDSLHAGLTACGSVPAYTLLRGPEAGLVMVRGRAGGSGPAFNFGEMTVTRCSVRTAEGLVGHAYVTGRNERQAELAALADALLQDPGRVDGLLAGLIEPLAVEQAERRRENAEKAAATKVQFFAMQTMRT